MTVRREPKFIPFGQRIFRLRKMNKMTQVQLQKKMGYRSTGSIPQMEMGVIGMDVNNIYKMSKILGVHPSSLFLKNNLPNELEEVLNLFLKTIDRPPAQRKEDYLKFRQIKRMLEK